MNLSRILRSRFLEKNELGQAHRELASPPIED